MTTEPASRRGVPELLAAIASGEEEGRRRLVGELAVALAASARTAGAVAVTSGRWLADLLIETAPRIPVRERATLLAHHDGLSDDALADILVRNATLATAGVGAAGGALSALKYAVPPTLATFPIQLAVETLAVAAIEVKLVGELHEAYDLGVTGSGTGRGLAYVGSWATRRGVDSIRPKKAITSLMSAGARRQVSRRLMTRVGWNVTTLAPMLAGAVAGAAVNGRETRKLAEALREDLHHRALTAHPPTLVR